MHIFDNESDMNTKEKELVVISEESYNLCPGGHGGFGYINSKGLSYPIDKARTIHREKLKTDLEYKKSFSDNCSKSKKGSLRYYVNFKGYDWTGKKHKDESKRKIGLANSLHQQGRNNSQYGTCWITNGQQNKKIKKEELDKWLELGYNKGRI